MSPRTVDVIVAGTDPKVVEPSLVGGKAYKLLELCWYGQSGDFRVPRFCILPVTLCQMYNQQRGGPPPVSYPALPSPDEIPAVVTAYYSDFYREYAPTLLKWARIMDTEERPYLRSSTILDIGSSLSFAGVNESFRPQPPPPGTHCLLQSIPQLLATPYRAYAEWYLRRHELQERDRSVAVIVGEIIHVETACTAYVINDVAIIDSYTVDDAYMASHLCLDNTCFSGALVSFSLSSHQQKWQGYWKQQQRGERVRRALANFVACLGNAHHLEIEFVFDKQDTLYLTQYRPLVDLCGSSQRDAAGSEPLPGGIALSAPLNFPIYHSIGYVQGPLYSLLRAERIPEALDVVLREVDRQGEVPVWLVHDSTNQKWDAFALMWALAQLAHPSPLRVILSHLEQRQRTHMVSTMGEDPSVDFVAQACARDLIGLPDGSLISIASDGLQSIISGQRKV